MHLSRSLFPSIKTFATVLLACQITSLCPPARAALLDSLTVQPSAAFGLRKLKNTYSGPALRLRRSLDNGEQDIGFTAAGDIDLAAIKAFAGSGDAFVAIWYDQTGNGAKVMQAAPTLQPQIVAGGALVALNGRLALSAQGACELSGSVSSSGYSSYTKSAVVSFDDLADQNSFFTTGANGTPTAATLYPNSTSNIRMWHGVTMIVSNTAFTLGSPLIVTALFDQPTHSSSLYQNGVSVGTSTSTAAWSGNNTVTLFNFNSNGLSGKMGEALLFSAKLSTTDRTTLESSQTSYWVTAPGASSPPSAPTSLATALNGVQTTLTWNGSANVAPGMVVSYLVEYKLSNAATWNTLGRTANASLVLDGVAKGNTYDFRVTPSVGASTGASSTVFTVALQTTVAAAPVQLSVVPGNTRVALNWTAPADNGGLALSEFLVEYRPPSGGSWTTFSHEAATAKTTVVTGLENGMAYDFRVSALNSLGSSVPAQATGTPNPKTFFQILSTGQSLSVGARSTPALTTTQPYANVMLSGGGPSGRSAPLIPLAENGTSLLETPSSGMANSLAAGAGIAVAVGLHGEGSKDYAYLKKGGTGNAFANGLTQATATRAYVEETLGCTYQPLAITVVHGEADYKDGLSSSYESYLVEWQSDYQNDLAALTGTHRTVPLFLNQLSSSNTGEMAVAQLQAHRNHPGKIYLVGPKYQYHYATDHVHLINTSSKLVGEMLAKVIKKVAIDGEAWDPLMPTSVIGKGNILTVDYHIPVGSLQIDTVNVAQRPNLGFEFVQTGGNTVTISSVQLVDNNTRVRVTLSAVPTGTNQRLRYAWGYQARTSELLFYQFGEAAEPSFSGGNIRDTDTSVSPAVNGTGLPLYDWSVSFEDPVVPAPVVNLALTNPTAHELNAVPGSFTITRTGSTNYSLPVSYSVTGTAANGIDYVALSGTATIPSGQSSSPISIVPLNDSLAEGPETVTVTLNADPNTYSLGTNSGTVSLLDLPIDTWRFAQFGVDANTPAVAGNSASPAGDGVSNLIKYALGLDPHLPAPSDRLPITQTEGDAMTLSFSRPVNVTDATYLVEVSSDLATWDAGSKYAPTGNVPSNAHTTEVANSTVNGLQTIKVRDNTTTSAADRRFIRLRIINP